MSVVSSAARGAQEPATTSPVGMRLAGWGTALPRRRVTNDDLAQTLDTSDAWIVDRSGIHERRWASPGETTRPLATLAAGAALARAGVAPADVGAVIVATTTPENPVPSTASQVAADLGIRAGAFDINAACAGFVYGLVVGSGLLASGAARAVLLAGADTMTSIIDLTDRSTAVLFGDGAAATVLVADTTAAPGNGHPAASPGLVASDLCTDPDGVELLVVPAGGSARPPSAETVAAGEHHLRMDGREVFRRAVRAAESSIARTLGRAGIGPEAVDLFVPHQANARIVDAVLNRTGLDRERTSSTIGLLGNTSAASIPLALAEASATGTVADGDLVLLCGFGAGLTVGSVLWRWGSGPAGGEEATT